MIGAPLVFGQPAWLQTLWGVPVLALLLALAIWHRGRARRRLADAALLGEVVIGRARALDVVRAVLVLLAATLLLFALSRPQAGMQRVPYPAQGIDVAIAVDLSLSMTSRDVPPSRLGLARRELHRLIDSLGGARVTLVAFAGEAYRQIPLTADYSALGLFIDVLDPGMLPYAGTDIGKGVESAIASLERRGGKNRLLVLVTDGGDHGGSLEQAARRLRRQEIDFFAVGVGGDRAAPIPEEHGVKKDRSGNIVTTRLERDALRRIASIGGGTYLELDAARFSLHPVLDRVRQLDGDRGTQGTRLVPIERFPWLIAAAAILLMIELLIPRAHSNRVRTR